MTKSKFIVSLLLVLAPALGNAAVATFTVDCSVGLSTGERLAHGEFAVTSMNDQTVYKDTTSEYIVGVSQVQTPDGNISPLLFMTIKKNGKMAAHSMLDFDAAKPGNANLTLNFKSPWFSCRPKASL